MSCCAPGLDDRLNRIEPISADEMRLASRDLGDGMRQTSLSVPGMHCGTCIRTIEARLNELENVVEARANLSTRQVHVRWRDGDPPPIVETLQRAGYAAHLFEPGAGNGDEVLKRLLRAVAVAGFASANIMLLSVSVWSGAEDATRDLFHWISALIAVPALAYSGRIFFESALHGLKFGRLNMDFPISLGLVLAFSLSLVETVNHGRHAYFDAVVMLMFFLLIGRTLDHVMREKARTAINGLARLSSRGALVVRPDGSREFLPLGEIRPGQNILVAAGERIPVDGRVERGASDLDCSIVNGEATPRPASPGTAVYAGTMNLSGPLTLTATATADESFLAEMRRLMQAAEGGEARYRRLADRAAAIYSPMVHLAAAVTFIAWYVIGGDAYQSIYTAIAVLIITCPCALGLAVPVVQVVAARRLFENGIMVKDGAALERLAECDTVVFDKTGTLTSAGSRLAHVSDAGPEAMALAGALAAHSRHPFSRAIAEAAPPFSRIGELARVTEHPGRGVEARIDGALIRLGGRDWALDDPANAGGANVVLARDGSLLAGFTFNAELVPDAMASLEMLRRQGFAVEILSGDHAESVRQIAQGLTVDGYSGGAMPADKLAHIHRLREAGHKVLMVGDGINDAPALSAAHASMAPASAADIGRSAAGFVYLRDSLLAVPVAIDIARRAGRLVRQNFALAAIYNLAAVPIAALGHVTPLVAALAMSLSSIVVILNALRLNVRVTAGTGTRADKPARRPAFTMKAAVR